MKEKVEEETKRRKCYSRKEGKEKRVKREKEKKRRERDGI